MMEKDFSFDIYRDLITQIQRSGFEILTVREFLLRQDDAGPFVILRHDVDRRPENALQMDLIDSQNHPRIYLQIHPNRWSWLKSQWYRQWGEDLCLNGAKLLLSSYFKEK